MNCSLCVVWVDGRSLPGIESQGLRSRSCVRFRFGYSLTSVIVAAAAAAESSASWRDNAIARSIGTLILDRGHFFPISKVLTHSAVGQNLL